jgi:hypothetical protein
VEAVVLGYSLLVEEVPNAAPITHAVFAAPLFMREGLWALRRQRRISR